MRLLIVTQSVDRNDPNLGAFYYWFEALARKTESLVILAGRVGDADFPPHVEVYSFGGARRGGRLGRVWKFWRLFFRHFARVDAVFFHQIPEFVIAASPLFIGRRKISALWYAHGQVTPRLRFAERCVDYVFTSSLDGFRVPSKKVIVLGQAINTDLFQPSADRHHPSANGAVRLLTIGRISPVKHYETIINACAILKNTWDRSFTLSIVGGPLRAGDREYLERLRALVAGKGLSAHIRFGGERPFSEIPDILRAHDLFLSVSRTGSLDKVVLEAMACGLTVLTSNDAYRTILPPPYFLEKVGPELLAEQIQGVADEPHQHQKLRDIVVRGHALAQTIERLYAYLSTPV